MAEFAKCHICRALMVDDPEDRREHLADHANTKRRIDALGRKNQEYLTEIAGLRDELKGYGKQLEQHPISATPESISINEMPDDEIDEFEESDSTYVDFGEGVVTDLNTPDEDADENAYPLSIDRPEEDDLDHRLANATGQVTPLS